MDAEKPLIVAKLIKVLRWLPPDAEVCTSWDGGLGGNVLSLSQIGLGHDEDGQPYVVFAEDKDGFRRGEEPISRPAKKQ